MPSTICGFGRESAVSVSATGGGMRADPVNRFQSTDHGRRP